MTATRRWNDLIPGLVALAALVTIVVGIALFAQVGTVRGKTFTLYVRVGEARGIMRGSSVWLAGQVVGQVEKVHLLSPGGYADSRVLMELTVSERHRTAIRSDSEVRIGTGGQVIGNPGVSLTIGSPSGEVVQPRDTIVARERPDVEELAARASSATEDLPLVLGNLREISRKVRSGEGSAGAIISDRGGLLQATTGRLEALSARMNAGGSLAGLRSEEFRRRVSGVMAQANSIRALLESEDRSLGRLTRDTALIANMEAMKAELEVVKGLLDRSEGTAGRIMNDGALLAALDSVQAELQALISDAKSRPLRYISF
jgi:phospholipid/cholesterol/gamma-HCH transport system substrate-binding protein